MARVELKLPSQAYEVHIEAGALSRLGEWMSAVAEHEQAALLCDRNVFDQWGSIARRSLEAAGYQVIAHALPFEEQNKNLKLTAELYDLLINSKWERKSPVIALGGGVAGDTVGFAAATYLRGVPFVQCPTTLLAMVDASVGGKVGVNLPQGKNLVGAFYQPVVVVIDTETLRTLPQRELKCGLAECVKHGVIRDAALFKWIEENLAAIENLDQEALVKLVTWNVEVKATVVIADEKESGPRAHLNFGHTFAHAIEATIGYGVYHHGEAVALGMVAATRLAASAGLCQPEVGHHITSLLHRIGLPTSADDLPPTPKLMDAMKLDKKVSGGSVRLVLPLRMGMVTVRSDLPTELIAQAWDSLRK